MTGSVGRNNGCEVVPSASRFDLDGPRFSLFSSGDGQPEHAICQARLNLVRVEVARQRKVAFEITDLVFLVNGAVALGRMILDLRVNVEGSPVERDR